MKAVLVLEDGTVLKGRGFGASGVTVGEVVFTTGMVGYTESLTDPSYKGQILVFTYPLIGNYGVPSYAMVDEFNLPLHFESIGIKVEGVVVHEACFTPSHWASTKNVNDWLREEGVPGIWGIDTRQLVQKLRERGVMKGVLAVYEYNGLEISELLERLASFNYGSQKLVEKVSVEETRTISSKGGKGLIVVIDCGAKLSIVRALLRRGYDVSLVRYDTPADKIIDLDPKGVVFSNGPGNPELYVETVDTARAIVEYGLPTLGVCLGHQIVSLAVGARTFKLRYGHRGVNKPVIDLTSGYCYMTSQNHGYAVDVESLKSTRLKVWFINADDKTVEGVYSEKGVLCTQFHPEASPGPNDTSWVFDYFSKIIENSTD